MARQSYGPFADLSAALFLALHTPDDDVSPEISELAEEVQQLLDGAMLVGQSVYTVDDLWALNIQVLQLLENTATLTAAEQLVAANCIAALAKMAHLVPRKPSHLRLVPSLRPAEPTRSNAA